MRSRAVLTMAVLVVASLAEAETARLIDFEIEDQFRQKHRDEDFQGHVVLVLAADRKGSPYCSRWGQGVYGALDPQEKEALRSLTVAKVKGVPFFLKGTVRGKFPKDEDSRILLDWKGQFHKSYGLAPETCNALVFDRAGRLVHRASGQEPCAEDVDAVVRSLRAELPERMGNE